MDKKEMLDNEQGAPLKSKKDAFNERFAQRFPDTDASNEDAYYDALSGEFDRIDRSDKAQRELGDLLAKDPRSAGFLMVLKDGGNPMEFLIEQYGDDFRDALNDKAKAKELASAFAKYTERKANEQAMAEQAESNLQSMLDELDAAQKDGSFKDEDATKAYDYLYGEGGLLDRILTNEIKKDDWLMLMKAANYDAMLADADNRVTEARTEGEITGRNANIDLQKRKREKATKMPSSVKSAGGGGVSESRRDDFLSMLDEKTKSVWDD